MRREEIADIVSKYGTTEHGQVNVRHILDILDEISGKVASADEVLISAKQRQEVESFIDRDPTLPMERSKVIDFVQQMLTVPTHPPAWSDASSILQLDRSGSDHFATGSGRSPLAQSTPTQSQHSQARAARFSTRFNDRRSPSLHRSSTEPRLQSLAELDRETERSGRTAHNATDVADPVAVQADQAHRAQVDRIRLLEEHERGLRDTILDNELQLQDLQERFETAEAALKARDRELQELKAVEMKNKQHIRDLERDVETTEKDAALARRQQTETRAELESQKREAKQMDALLGKVQTEVSVLEARQRQGAQQVDNLTAEKSELSSRVRDLLAAQEGHERTEARLRDAEQACKRWEEQVRCMQRDIDELKAGPTEQSVKAESVRSDAAFEGCEAIGHRTVDVQQESFKRLGRDIQLQRTLIDRLIQLTSKNNRRAAYGGRGASAAQQAIRTARTTDTAADDGLVTKGRSAVIVVLYSIIVLMLGYVLAQHAMPLGRPVYGEYRAWQRANDLAPAFTPYGLDTSGLATRWWEGGPRLIEQAGFWLEQHLLDGPWPS